MVLGGVVAWRQTVVGLAFLLFVSVFVVLPPVEAAADTGSLAAVGGPAAVDVGVAKTVPARRASGSGSSVVGSLFGAVRSGLLEELGAVGVRGVGVVGELLRLAAFVPPAVDLEATVEFDAALVTSVAGDGTSGVADGLGVAASFGSPVAVTVADEGTVVVDGHSLRLVDRSDFDVATWVGDAAVAGCVDSADPSLVRLTSPEFVTTDLDYVYVIDSCSVSGGAYYAIRRVDLATGATDTLPGAAADIRNPRGMTYAPDGYLYVTTLNDDAVWQVNRSTGAMSSVHSSGQDLEAIAADDTHLYVMNRQVFGNFYRDSMVKISLSDFSGVNFGGRLDVDRGVLVSAGDYLYGVSADGEYLKRWDKSDESETGTAGSGAVGFVDGVENEAWFGRIDAVATDGDRLWIVDGPNYRLRTASDSVALPRGATPFSDTEVVAMSGSMVVTVETTLEDGDGNPANNPPLTFTDIRDVAVVGGDAYVANRDAIYQVDLATGIGELLSGIPGTPGCTDSIDPELATFDIHSMTTDGYWLYVFNDHGAGACDGNWSGGTQLQLRRVSTVTGAVSPLRVYNGFHDMTAGPDGLIYVATGSANGARVRWIDPTLGNYDDVLPDPMTYTSFNATAEAVAADDTKLWLVNNGLNGPNRLWSFAFPGYTETMIRDDHPRDEQMVSAGSSLIQAGGTSVSVVDKSDGSSVTVAGNGVSSFYDNTSPGLEFTSIAGVAHDGDAIYVVDSGTDRLRMIVDAFNPPGAFAFGYDGYGSWRHGVNAGLGNFVWSATDAAVATAGPELAVSRIYNSSDPRVGPFGVGWTFSYDMRWRADSAGNVTVLFPDGRRETHVPDGSGGWLAPEGYFSVLAGTVSSGFTLTMKDDTVYTFNTDGALTLITDANGHT
ncbi:MAG: hypothetical protein GY788_23300, partial [bacterium]|nr:hypothetical protein [bacterium]